MSIISYIWYLSIPKMILFRRYTSKLLRLFDTGKRSPSLKILAHLAQVRAEFLLPTASLSPTAARGGFSALVRHPQPDSYGGLKGLPACPSEGGTALLFTSKVYHENRENAIWKNAQNFRIKNVAFCAKSLELAGCFRNRPDKNTTPIKG